MTDKCPSFSPSLLVNAAELRSLEESAYPVVIKLCAIAATNDFADTSQEDLRSLRAWVDHAYIALVELCEFAADRVDAELGSDSPPAATHPSS